MTSSRTAGLLLVVSALMSPHVSSHSDCTYTALLRHLGLSSSNVTLQVTRPVKQWSMPTVVRLDMLLYGILEVNEKFQTVTNHIWISTEWSNEFLTWNPSDFCGIPLVSVPRASLWAPDIGIQEDTSDTGSIHKSEFVNIHSNGTVVGEVRQRLTYTCQLKLNMFPFDKQSCNITFLSQSAEANALMLGTVFNGTTLSSISERIMITQGEWGLINLSTHHSNVTPGPWKCKLTYTVTFERKPLLYVINFIVPLFYLLVLDLTSFFISEARGEKMSFKITILLSISVLLLILKDLLPSTEDHLPHIASYCIGIFALVGLSVLESMLVTFLVDLDDYCAAIKKPPEDEDVPLEVDYLAESAGSGEKGQEKPVKVLLPLTPCMDQDLLKKILEELRAARQVSGKTTKEKKTYKHMAEVLDHVYFFFYFAAVVVFMVYMYTKWMRNLVDG